RRTSARGHSSGRRRGSAQTPRGDEAVQIVAAERIDGDRSPRAGCVNELVVADVDTYMRDATPVGTEEDKVALFQFLDRYLLAIVGLSVGTVGQLDPHVPGHHVARESGTIKPAAGCSPPAIPDAARLKGIADHRLLAALGRGKLSRFRLSFTQSVSIPRAGGL